MEKFAFIILNYCCMEETINCIESIQKLSYEEKYIVVVDNASDNQKEFFQHLKAKFTAEKNIVFLRSNSNLGYARGNNIGIDYARNQLHADFVCVVNPDIIIETKDFVEKSIALYKEHNYAVLGPSIIDHGVEINPLGGYNESVGKRLRTIFINYKICFVKKWNLGRFNILKRRKAKSSIGSEDKWKSPLSSVKGNYFLHSRTNCMLSGACMVFSPTYFQEFSGFCKDTFLYYEETILAFVCYHMGYGLLYSSELLVVHGGRASVKKVEADDVKRSIFFATVGNQACFVVFRIIFHKNDLDYLRRCLNPVVDDYSLV